MSSPPTVPDLGIEVSAEDVERLQETLDGAISWVTRRCGPFAASATWTRTVSTAGGLVLLRVPALLTVDSATAGTSAVAVSDVDPLTSSCRIGYVHASVTFTGTHGHPDGVPDEMRVAAILLAQHRWLYRQGLTAPRRADGYSSTSALNGYAVPNAVRDLVRSVPGTVPAIG